MTDSTDNARGLERYKNTVRNVILNRTLTDLDRIINGHDPEVDTSINNLVWDRLDKMALEIEAHAVAARPSLNSAVLDARDLLARVKGPTP